MSETQLWFSSLVYKTTGKTLAQPLEQNSVKTLSAQQVEESNVCKLQTGPYTSVEAACSVSVC